MRISPTRLILGLAIIAGLAAEWQQWHAHRGEARPPQVAGIGDQAPDLSLPDLQGQPHRLSEFHGSRRILNFWASWCGPCQQEMPALDHAATTAKADIIGIAMDSPMAVRQFLAARPVHYPVLLGQLTPPSSSARFDDDGGMLPYSVLLDADGKVLARHAGALDPALLARWLDPAQAP